MRNNVISLPVINQLPHITHKMPSIVRNLANVLMLRLQISPSRSLVCIIGSGHEHSNQEAVETWLMTQFGIDGIEALSAPRDQLADALRAHLNNKLNNLED